jgi:hypothetical protein
MGRPVLSIDFDGTLHSYTSGWRGAAVVPDPPVPGAAEFIRAALALFTVAVVSSRFNHAATRAAAFLAVGHWLIHRCGIDSLIVPRAGWPEGGFDRDDVVILCDVRPPALITIDDRALTFAGTWPDVAGLLDFRPWNRPPVTRPVAERT